MYSSLHPRTVARIVAILLVSVLPVIGTPETSLEKEYVYLWYPRSTDISSDADAPERIILSSILALAVTREYEIRKGDNLDYLLRKLFAVSTSQTNAYHLYLNRLFQLNPELKFKPFPQPGTRIIVPSGPRFSSTALPTAFLSIGVRSRAFYEMSRKAYFGPKRQRSASIDELKHKAAHSLGFLIAPDKSSLSIASEESIFAAVRKEGLIPPINRQLHPEEDLRQVQPIRLRATTTPSALEQVAKLRKTEKNGNFLPGLIPMTDSVSFTCTSCQSCAALINLPQGVDTSRARILIEDTGIMADRLVSAPGNLIHKPLNDDGTEGDGSDIDTKHHGTFIFDQISQSASGLLNPKQIFVAKVAKKTQTSSQIQYSMADIIQGWQKFAAQNTDGPNTLVVNISASGEVPPDTDPAPQLPIQNILVVAAAGNENNSAAPVSQVFGKLSGNGANLLIVGALAADDKRATYSNFHPQNVQIFATGNCVCGSAPFNPTTQINGTSQAAPLVALGASVLASAHPDWLPSYVMWRLISTADLNPQLHGFGLAGRINLKRALTEGVQMSFLDSEGHLSSAVGISATFDPAFQSALDAKLFPTAQTSPILRIYNPMVIGDVVCFSYLRFRQESESSDLCVPATSAIRLADHTGTIQTVRPNQLADLILPIPSDI